MARCASAVRRRRWGPNVTVLRQRDVTAAGVRPVSAAERVSRLRKGTAVRVFVAGGSGVLGRRLVPQLVARGHRATVTTTGAARLGLLRELGADEVVMDGLDALSVGAAVVCRPPGRDRPSADRDLRGARRQARHQAPRPLVRSHQPAAHRGHGPSARRRRGDRRTARRRAEPRQLERCPRGRLGEDGGGSAGPDGGDARARRDAGAAPPGGRGPADRRRGPALRRLLRPRRRRRPGGTDPQAPAPAGRPGRGGTAAGSTSTTRRARPSSRWSGKRGACSTSTRAGLGWEPRYPSWRQGFKEELA